MMLGRKVLSIILTAHNCAAYLDQTLATLLSSLHGLNGGYEIILISDASIDRTVEILQQFSERHVCHTRLFQVNFGNIGKVRNFGVLQSAGDYITMVDGDDWLLAGALYDVLRFLEASEPELLLTRLNEEHGKRNLNVSWKGLKPQLLSQPEAIKKFLIHKDMQAHFIGQFVKRELLLAHPFLPFHCYEDAYLFPAILRNAKRIVFSRSSPYLYFKRRNSLSSQMDSEKIALLIAATEEMERVFGDRYADLIACHWINIFHRYAGNMHDMPHRQKIMKKIQGISSISFFLNFAIRLSFKRKYIKIKCAMP
ncbi:Glycosyl transferase 2 family protein [Serratia symbiotica]|nr:Glycosyl transferase 2 family protein [Serratia symbiotica]